MKLLVIGAHLVVKEYQELWVASAKQFPDLDIEILCPKVFRQSGGLYAKHLAPEVVPVHTLRAFAGRFGRFNLHFYYGLKRALDRIRPDYVYCVHPPNALVTSQVAHDCVKRGIPYVFWTSLNSPRIYRKMYGRLNVRRYLYDWCQRYVFATSSGANATSDAAVEVLRRQGYQGRILNRPIHGIGDVFLKVGRRRVEEPNRTSLPARIGFVGGYYDYKGIDILIRAFARMPSRDRVRLVLRGDGPEAAALRELARREGVARSIDWEPMVPYSEMPHVLRQLDILVLPSIERSGTIEKFGRVLIEAMASGVVAVGSRTGGIPLALGDGGIVVEPGNPDRLAEVLDGLCCDADAWKVWQKRGYETVRDTYGFEVVGRNLIEGLRAELDLPKADAARRPVMIQKGRCTA